MSCYLCGSHDYRVRSDSVRDNQDIKVLECAECHLVYLSSLAHIKADHYESSGMHDGKEPDVESWIKETANDDERRYQFIKDKITNRSVLDFGCGIGGFIERAKSRASAVTGIELEAAIRPSFQRRGLTVFQCLEDAQKTKQKWDIVTAFHVLEHLTDPAGVLKQLSELLNHSGEIIVEVPSSDDALLTLYENADFQSFTYWSQHLFLFNAKTMSILVTKAGLKLNWIKQVQRYPLVNHLYWLAKGKSGGHKQWSFMSSDELNKLYEQQLAAIGLTDTIIASISR